MASMVTKLTIFSGVLLASFEVARCTEYIGTAINLTVDVTKWEKETSDYDWENQVNATFLNNITVGGNVTVATILANPDECYSIRCYGYYYDTKLDIDFPSTRKDSVTQYRSPDGDLFNSTQYHRETTFRFFTEQGKNGTVVCKSVDRPELSVTLHILTEDYQIPHESLAESPNPTNSSNSGSDSFGKADLFSSQKHGGVYCYDQNNLPTTKSMKMILCSSPHECDLFKNCFNPHETCRASSQTGTQCETADCVIIDEGYLNGMAECRSGNDVETAYYFTGFDKRKYKLSENIPTKAMISMEDVDPILYTNKPHFFFCSAVSFLFTNDIQFSVKYKNGTQTSIPNERVQSATDEEKESRVARDVVQKGIHVNLTQDMTEIICMAPWYNNSTEWLTLSRKFQAIDAEKPSIIKLNSTQQWNNSIFYLNDSGRILDCSAKGQPPPTFTWYRIHGNQSLEMEAEVENNNGFAAIKAEGESILKFPLITHGLKGKYRCKASNDLGSDQIDFQVDVVKRRAKGKAETKHSNVG